MEDKVTRSIGWGLYGAIALVTAALALMLWLEVAAVGRLLPMGGLRLRLTVWASALLAATLVARLGRSPGQAVGMALMTVPLWGAGWAFVNSIPELSIVSDPLPAQSPEQLSARYIRSILYDVSYLGLGLLLWARPRLDLGGIAQALHRHGFRLGASEGRSVLVGVTLFPMVLASTWALNWFITHQTPQLVNGDESAYWSNMTLYHAVMISAAAAFTEELVYRVLALGIGTWAARRVGLGPVPAAAVGVVLQAVLFAMAHGGYGTWAHVLFPALFGLLMGALVIAAGVWAAIAIHFLIDFFVFGSEVAAHEPAASLLLWVLLGVNLVVAAVVGVRLARQRGAWRRWLRVQWD